MRDQVLPRRLAKQQSPKNKQRIEPSSCLINTLAHEISRVLLLNALPVLERVVHLGKRHTASDVNRLKNNACDGVADLPDSNQQSNTSSTRFRFPLPFFEGMVMWSMLSRCRSVIPVTPDSSSSSLIEPIEMICEHTS